MPNGIVTEWQYNWKDQVTNITHKIASTILATASYERASGGEPIKITREDGTYVVLAYDAALRLTNEVYYNSGNVAQTTNSYAYDGSGSRIRLAKSGTAITNAVFAGYRVTTVKNAANGATIESYGYDSGGRITTITRDSATLNLGYNSADQVTAVTNGSTWVSYLHDASGRRTVSTNSAGTVRRLLVAPVPGSDLESPHLIANASGALQQGYVYLGFQPLMRYDGSGATGYYLEDGMGSVIGIAPSGSPGTANTTRLFYDGFGNSRATNGPAPTIPNGTGGDFRFQACWLETGSGLYNMRAREYDSRTGRFTSRDLVEGETETPESLHPYNFADCNPYVNSDRNGETTMIEINIVNFLQFALQTMRSLAIDLAKQSAIDKLTDAFYGVLFKQMSQLWGKGFDIGKISDYIKDVPGGFGNIFDRAVQAAICYAFKKAGADSLGDEIHFRVDVWNRGPHVGDPLTSGSNCNGRNTPVLGFLGKRKASKPDFIFGPSPLVPPGGKAGMQQTYFVAEVKGSASVMYNSYILPGKQRLQLNAILAYTGKHTETHVAFFIIAKNDFKRGLANKARYYAMKRIIGAKALRRNVVPIMVKVL